MALKKIRSVCRGCHGVCQVFVHLEGDRVIKVTGDNESPSSNGYLCPKGAAAPELLYHPDRLLYPLRRMGLKGENKWNRISWDEALDEIAERFSTIREESGPEYLGIYKGTGRPYYEFTTFFANAFGTPNVGGVSHICYFPRLFAGNITLGQLPIADVYGFGGEMPRCMVIWGCNVTETGASDGMCGGMVQRALKNAQKVIVVDPRRIGPAKKADHWLQLRPGTDGALALAMLNVVVSEDLVDRKFVENYTIGYEELIDHIRPFTPKWAAAITRLEEDDILKAARAFATSRPACIQWGNAIDMSTCNFQTARAILILMAITGNIDRPGGNWLTVQVAKLKKNPPPLFLPEDMLHRKLDGNKYPISAAVHPTSFWRSVVTGRPYRLRAMWIMGANPLVTLSHSLEVEKALNLLDFIVATDFFLTPTAQFADIVLPAATWLEQDDVAKMVTIWCALARKKVAQVGEVMDDKEIYIQLARRMGFTDMFPWKNLREHLDWVLEDTGMDFDDFCEKGILVGEQKYHKYRTRGFNTPSKKLEIYSDTLKKLGVSPLPVYREPPLTPLSAPEALGEYPLILTSCKTRPFFHSEGRQIKSLRKRNPDPLMEIHPDTALSLGINDGDWVWIETQESRVKSRVRFYEGVAKDVVNAQYAWWFPEAPPPEYDWKSYSLNMLYGDTEYDPDTGSEPLKSWLCKIYPLGASGLQS